MVGPAPLVLILGRKLDRFLIALYKEKKSIKTIYPSNGCRQITKTGQQYNKRYNLRSPKSFFLLLQIIVLCVINHVFLFGLLEKCKEIQHISRALADTLWAQMRCFKKRAFTVFQIYLPAGSSKLSTNQVQYVVLFYFNLSCLLIIVTQKHWTRICI